MLHTYDSNFMPLAQTCLDLTGNTRTQSPLADPTLKPRERNKGTNEYAILPAWNGLHTCIIIPNMAGSFLPFKS